jgi:hypothetical protein
VTWLADGGARSGYALPQIKQPPQTGAAIPRIAERLS